MNKFLNITVGGLGLLYVLNDTYFRLLVKFYLHRGYSSANAEKIANSTNIFSIIIILTILLVIFGVLAVISNMVYFMRGNFIFKLFLNCVAMSMPFLYVRNIWFSIYELFFCGIFIYYIWSLKKSTLNNSRRLLPQNRVIK
ncbi:hypothetical protein LM596_06095 [Liquorilactobacillus mali]|uniref:Uncharacterized protein n=2 Tax=Liquorilactobacillus mali TaxID=1618 RepID=J0URK8_9LACO|nr:hypothetical protein [Liquorilactobacillus mali]EJE99117.1 hypothetical protein LMA_06351 [Liquorilactobacillus mali KCTC 3596 = DSM 20444]KRN08788.1 hypothetical protein FD00_GL001768 [Liquorilactobacillus mali KCTC 3596 = DSM 20444]KRN30124.1 hypothetical protein IV36_GL002376 [Liquorilactobacillus mali]MDN7144740.1 hypothetical protein [Liquorilactobacillus mali]QFQ74707.1 hypothetical protein LM596_06095 [Liquorilactobacillus mali]